VGRTTVIPDLLDLTERLAGQEAFVDCGEQLGAFGVAITRGDVTGHIRARVGDSERPVGSDRERTARTVSARAGAHVARELAEAALEVDEIEAGVAVFRGQEVEAAAIVCPARTLHVAIERAGQQTGICAVAVHHVQLADLVTLVLIIEADVGDVLAVGRNRRLIVRAFAIRQRFGRAVGHGEFINLGVLGLLLIARMAVG